MKKKNNILLYVIIVLLVVIVILLGVLLFRKNDTAETDTEGDVTTSEDVNINHDTGYTKEELFSMVSGIWKYVNENGVNYATRFFINENGELYFSSGRYGTDGGIYGVLEDTLYLNESSYQLTIFSEGCHGDGCLDETDDATYYAVVDITDINNKKITITINDITNIYEYVADTWEEAADSFSY